MTPLAATIILFIYIAVTAVIATLVMKEENEAWVFVVIVILSAIIMVIGYTVGTALTVFLKHFNP